MATNERDEFVTIVPVGQPDGVAKRAAVDAATFVTVLSVGAESGAAEVTINRPRGSRLGLGLKFEGGSGVAEHVQRLLVQSCSDKSPADKALSPWGKLIPGDEIVAIDGVFVSKLTRIECVRRLKNSDEILKILVRHTGTVDVNAESHEETNVLPTKDIFRPTNFPPPVPPRKINKKIYGKNCLIPVALGEEVKDFSNKVDITSENFLVSSHCIIDKMSLTRNTKLLRKSSLDSHSLRKCIESAGVVHKRRSPEEVRRLVRRLSDSRAVPPVADTYIDLLSQECERRFIIGDCESDDTGSSISTVVDRMSSMVCSLENSKLSTPNTQTKIIDTKIVLKSMENIESEKTSQIQASSIEKRDDDKKTTTEIKSNLTETSEIKVNFQDEVKIQNQELTSSVPKYCVTKIIKSCLGSDGNNNTNGNITCINIEFDEPHTGVPGNIRPKIRPKPQPLPRNIKVMKVPDGELKTMSTESNSKLLCPNKKVCIENWLQTSVECKPKLTDVKPDYEEESSEALPRLIDFVTKSQYKPAEKVRIDVEDNRLSQSQYFSKQLEPSSREEGVSLNTIGEDDEGFEALHANPQVALKNYYEAKNIAEQRIGPDGTGWQDTCIESDQHKMINYSGIPPNYSRQPPDGDEAPCEVDEACLVNPAAAVLLAMPAIPTSNSLLSPEYKRRSIYSRLQDARSECSVKEKIALFSNHKALSTDRINKIGILPNTKPLSHHPYASQPQLFDRRLTKSSENLDELPNNTYSQRNIGKRPEVVGAIDRTILYDEIDGKNSMKDSHFIFPDLTKYYNTNVNEETVISIIDKFSDPVKDNHKSSKSTLEYFVKQRKEAMSKLRNLMIPEVKTDKIVDLPEIKVQNAHIDTRLNKLNSFNPDETLNVNKSNNVKESTKSTPTASWKTNSLLSNIPKYSPAFKRKSLQVFNNNGITISQRNLVSNEKRVPLKPPRTSILHNKVGKTIEREIQLPLAIKPSRYNNVSNDEVSKKRLSSEFADSDNDSAVSSIQSSCRSSVSSPLPTTGNIESDSSHVSQINSDCTSCLVEVKSGQIQKQSTELRGEKPNATRSTSTDTSVSFSSSTGSAATSGSQASCSSMESSQDICLSKSKNRIGRTHSIDTMHRRHILDSAKCRSGRDLKSTPPLIVAHCSQRNENALSPRTKRLDRLTTLNLNVSANSNKGEKRRTWAKHIESDTDSDNELPCQRKNDFKSSRPRKNISAASRAESIQKEKEFTLKPELAGNHHKNRVPFVLQDYKEKAIKFTENECAPSADMTEDNQVVNDSTSTSVCITEKSVNKSTSKTDTLHLADHGTNITNNDEIVKDVCNIANERSLSPIQVKKCIRTVRLQRGAGAGVGLVLAGGVDCEAKTVTIHKVLSGSPADKDGRLCKGTRVLSINGHDMTGATHAHSVSVLKELRPEVILVVEGVDTDTTSSSEDTQCAISERKDNEMGSRELISVALVKNGAGAGLGLGLAGGRDGPDGDRPLTVNKLFTGGAAARSGHIAVGATLEMVNGQCFDGMTRTQAWNMLKALSPGPVTLVIRPPPGRTQPS